MENKKSGMKFLAAPILVVLVFAVVLTGLNAGLGPIIEENKSSQAFGPLMAVMPEAENFELVEAQLPDTVLALREQGKL